VRTRVAPRLKEADIQRTITDLLELDGWRHIKTDPVSDRARGKGFGEKGMADDLYIRYNPSPMWVAPGAAQVLWIEHKRPKGVVPQHQKDWHAAERARGALTLIAGQDFPASVDGFWDWYRASGLMRKDIRL
jgi:hypothetical protein